MCRKSISLTAAEDMVRAPARSDSIIAAKWLAALKTSSVYRVLPSLLSPLDGIRPAEGKNRPGKPERDQVGILLVRIHE